MYAPEVIRLGDGSYRMYYSGWSEEICGGVFSATSEDGRSWHRDTGPCSELGGRWDGNLVYEPFVTQAGTQSQPDNLVEMRDRDVFNNAKTQLTLGA